MNGEVTSNAESVFHNYTAHLEDTNLADELEDVLRSAKIKSRGASKTGIKKSKATTISLGDAFARVDLKKQLEAIQSKLDAHAEKVQIKPKPQKPGRPKVNPVVPDILVSKKKLVPQKRAIAEPKKVPKQKKPLVKITSFFKKKTD